MASKVALVQPFMRYNASAVTDDIRFNNGIRRRCREHDSDLCDGLL